VSAGAEFRRDARADRFRRLILARGGRLDHLPDDAFEASGTSVRTMLAIIPGEEE